MTSYGQLYRAGFTLAAVAAFAQAGPLHAQNTGHGHGGGPANLSMAAPPPPPSPDAPAPPPLVAMALPSAEQAEPAPLPACSATVPDRCRSVDRPARRYHRRRR